MYFTKEAAFATGFLLIFIITLGGVFVINSLNSDEADEVMSLPSSAEEYQLYYNLDNPFEVIARDQEGNTYETLGYSTEKGYIYKVIGDGS